MLVSRGPAPRRGEVFSSLGGRRVGGRRGDGLRVAPGPESVSIFVSRLERQHVDIHIDFTTSHYNVLAEWPGTEVPPVTRWYGPEWTEGPESGRLPSTAPSGSGTTATGSGEQVDPAGRGLGN